MTSQSDGRAILLTEEEVERIRATSQARLKKCSELSGKARETRDVKAAISEATGASLMADMAGGTSENVTRGSLPVVVVGQPYPPCPVPLKDLEPMKLADLTMETHHHGRRLAVKRASPVVTLTARSWTMVQDQDGDEIERLEMCVHTSRDDEDVLESTKDFVIKEPFFTLTDQGEATIRIDHPSDLVAFEDESALTRATSNDGGKDQSDDAETAENLARAGKTKGNAALKRKDLPQARTDYTRALKYGRQDVVAKTHPDLSRDIARNRAYVNLRLDRFDEAILDSKTALVGEQDQRSKDLDGKAYYYAGCAAYSLGEYQEAKTYFEQLEKLTPGDEDAKAYLKRIRMRLREQEEGTYDMKRIRASVSRGRPRVDAATFTCKTKVKDSPVSGHGLFAAVDIPAGEVVGCEKAFCVVWTHEKDASTAMTHDIRDDKIRASPLGLTRSIVRKLANNPSQIKKVMEMYGDYQGSGTDVASTEEEPIVDVFRIQDIVSRNAFGPGNQFDAEEGDQTSAGLWIWAAIANHSCAANVIREHVGDLLLFRAARSIAAGEEIFGSYTELTGFDARQAALMDTWGFECKCALCSVEKGDDPAVRRKRKELAKEADVFVQREHWANAKRLTIVKAQRLLKALDATYDGEKYKGLPRIATRGIRDWLAKASPRR